MEVKYKVIYLDLVVKRDIPTISASVKPAIKRGIEKCLMTDPIGFGKPLRYSLNGHRRLRISDYRIVYRIEPADSTVIIVAIKHRKEVYKKF